MKAGAFVANSQYWLPVWLRSSAVGLVLPGAFVLIYGSGFVGAMYGLPYSPPLTFLSIRFALAAALIALLAVVMRAPWPGLRQGLHIAVAGLLTVGVFSIGVFVSLQAGIAPATSALIIALQPLLIAVLASRMVAEHVDRRQWAGLLIGFVGVALVVGRKIQFDGVGVFAVAMSFFGLLGVTLGNLYQKRYCARMNVLTGGAIQSTGSALMCLPAALLFETVRVEWSGQFVAALLYMAIGVSCGALSLLYIMIRRGEVSRVASVFYLMPVSAAAASVVMFGARLDPWEVVGMVIVGAGVLIVNLRRS